MTTLKDNVNALNELIINDETVKAMELFYSHDVEMQENEDKPRKGKENCIMFEKMILETFDIVSILINQAIDEEKNVVFSEWELQFTNKETKKASKRIEVSVQQWHEGLIESEKFYYNKAPHQL